MSVKKALVVDDSKLARITLKKKLELRAVAVDMAESASEALQYLQSHQPDIIFMDHLMPDIDGFEATRRIKANPATRHIPVIMCTGKEHEGYLQEATAIGASNILSKPPETDALDAILTMDLVPAAEPAAMAEPPILQPVAPAAVAHTLAAANAVEMHAGIDAVTNIVADVTAAGISADAEIIDDSFDADAAFGAEPAFDAAEEPAGMIDTSELESLSGFDTAADANSNDDAMLLAMEGVDNLDSIDSLEEAAALATLNDMLEDTTLGDVTEALTDGDAFFGETLAEDTPAEVLRTESVADAVVSEAAAFVPEAEAAFVVPETVIAEPVVPESVVPEPIVPETSAPEAVAADAVAAMPARDADVALPQFDIAAANVVIMPLLQKELTQRLVTLRETVIADLTHTLRRQIDDVRDAFGGNSEQQDGRLRALEQKITELVDNGATTSWVLQQLPPAIDKAQLTDDIAARIALAQTADVMPSDDMISLKARLDEAESELAMLRRREAPVLDTTTLQSLLPTLSHQLDTLLQQRIPVIVSDISDQVQLQIAYQMNDGRAPAPAVPSLDNIITNQADIETQLAVLKKQLSDEWTARLQALVKQLKDQLQHAPLPTSVDTSALRQQWRDDARDDINRALAAFKSQHPAADSHVEVPAADASHFEQMLETVTNQFARTQAEYEQKLKQSRLIAIGAVLASVVVSAAMAIFL